MYWRKQNTIRRYCPASYGMTDTMGRMHSDAQFAGFFSDPAHVEMIGFMSMVGMTVAVEESLK